MQKNGLTFGVKRKERSSMEAIMAAIVNGWPVGWFFFHPFERELEPSQVAGKGVFRDVLFCVFASSCFT